MSTSLAFLARSGNRALAVRRRADRSLGGPGRALALAAAALVAAAAGAGAAGPLAVTGVADLQAKVADPANAGRRLVLAPGTYTLDPSGPTAGRLELQTDMELEGVPGDSGLVIIDASLLDQTPLPTPPLPQVPSSYLDGTFFTGALRTGRGHNAVRWMTLRNAARGTAFVETDLAPTFPGTETSVTIERCVIEGNARGIDLRLLGAAASGRTLTATFKNNVLRNNTSGMGQGLRIAILQQAAAATLRVTIHGNSLAGNLAGLLAASNASSGGTIAIDSKSNRYSDNGVGCVLVAGIATGSPQAGDDEITFDSHSDEFERNDLPTSAYLDAGAGLVAMGGDSVSAVAGKTNRDSTRATLRNAIFSANPTADIVALGARGANGLVAGTDNEVLLLLLGGTRDPVIHRINSIPPEPTNQVTVVQHPGP